ncbi:unnamed protein product [Vitrella brassicaformis CCMP3155]|uniref:Uncharacterized protein n=1 Tax=Vitrella brassicaformis (strain CCMP3155) TaxID=1169540 RepID=A0A0G4GQS7_VITBC|nr:unnamed protein product [Vitrella brassicaformis CCMP3155]|eukprot:CEM32813.1 unnamed protein product [Vitrella brassicaformis CCMP3155]
MFSSGPLVHTLNFSDNPLQIEITHFLQPFRALPSLTYLSCEKCMLFGAITDDALCHFAIEELEKWLSKPSEERNGVYPSDSFAGSLKRRHFGT